MTSFIDEWSAKYFFLESSGVLDYLNSRGEIFVLLKDIMSNTIMRKIMKEKENWYQRVEFVGLVNKTYGNKTILTNWLNVLFL